MHQLIAREVIIPFTAQKTRTVTQQHCRSHLI
jgi:hypothetical protein